MSANAAALFIPGFATVFHADPLTPMPAGGLSDFSLTGTAPAGWENLGHTSRENVVNFGKSGGEPTALSTMLATAVRTIYSDEAWTLNVPALQYDEDVLDLAFNGQFDTDGGYIVPGANNGVERALVLFLQDGTGKLGFWIPSNSLKLSGVPDISQPGRFSEIVLAASMQTVDDEVIPAVNGVPGLMKIYKTGLVQSVPYIDEVDPATAAAAGGALIHINGSGFTGVTGAAGVKVGAVNVGAANYEVVDDEHIVFISPAVTAGAQPVTVTNSTGTSEGVAFTVTA